MADCSLHPTVLAAFPVQKRNHLLQKTTVPAIVVIMDRDEIGIGCTDSLVRRRLHACAGFVAEKHRVLHVDQAGLNDVPNRPWVSSIIYDNPNKIPEGLRCHAGGGTLQKDRSIPGARDDGNTARIRRGGTMIEVANSDSVPSCWGTLRVRSRDACRDILSNTLFRQNPAAMG